jgi:hypothetical protein
METVALTSVMFNKPPIDIVLLRITAKDSTRNIYFKS